MISRPKVWFGSPHCLTTRIIIALTLLKLATAPLSASEFSKEKKTELGKVLIDFQSIFTKKDYSRFADFMPPKVWTHIKVKSGISDQQLRNAFVKVVQDTFEKVELAEFSINIVAATQHDLPNGEAYLLIPTRTKVVMPESGYAIFESQTLAFLDQDKWYLVRISDLQQQIFLKAAYPEFGAVEFPAQSENYFKE